MSLTIATNTASLNTQKWLNVSNAGQATASGRLSSGFKINKAADDAAGIAIALTLNVKAVSISKSIDNGNQAVAMLQTAESGVETLGNMLVRMKELATEAASDNVSDTDRGNLDTELQQLMTRFANVATATTYGSTALLTGATFTFQLGSTATAENQVAVTLDDFSGLAPTGDITSLGNAQTFLGAVDTQLDLLNTARATIGAAQNEIGYQISNIQGAYENTRSAISTIKDTDYASEMSNFTKYQVMTQAGIAMLAQTNQLPQAILTLLKG
jgi:flagellin